jgi:peptidoglycan/LPS O-acetylase OafA/YrhL
MTEAAPHVTPKHKYIESLDGIRGIGCFAVMLTHFHFSAVNIPFTFGLIALHSFFIMSAYLITRNLLKERHRSAGMLPFFKIFYVKRTARIFPVYFLYIFVVIAIFGAAKVLGGPLNKFGVVSELKHYGWMLFTFLYNFKVQVTVWRGLDDHLGLVFPHLWSVSLEEQFYFMVIFMLWFCNKKALQVISIIFIVVIPFVRIYGYHVLGQQTHDEFLRTLTIVQTPYYQFDSFFYGIAMAVFDIKKSKIWIYIFYAALAILLGHAFMNAVLLADPAKHITFFNVLRDDEYFYKNYGIYFLDIGLNVFCCAWIYCVMYFPEKFPLFSNKYLVKFGVLSYGMYIFQFLVLGVGVILNIILLHFLHFPTFAAELSAFIFYILLNYYLAKWINRRIEIPVAKYRDKVLKRLYARQAAQ